MDPIRMALIGTLVAAAGSLTAGNYTGTSGGRDKGVAAAGSLSAGDFKGTSGDRGKGGGGTTQTKKINAKIAKELRAARIAKIKKKIRNINVLIVSVNEKLQLRTSGPADFDQKRALENQLRDLITLFALTDRALTEAGRLSREVSEIMRNARKGPRDSKRLRLANFLDARRSEYITFATR